MIGTIKSEWRKGIRRPALLVGTGLIAAIDILVYGVMWYQATHPGSAQRPVSLLALYPDHFVNNAMGAAYPIGAAIAIVLGALFAGAEYSWGTVKTMLTQRPGRLTGWAGRVTVFLAWMGIMAVVLFAFGAGSSAVVAAFEGHAITWPAGVDIVKGVAAVWLVFAVNGAIGLALGVLLRQSAAALGAGLIYALAIEIIAVRFIDGLNGGAYKWIGDLFAGQNASALLQSFGPNAAAASVGAGHAVLVLVAYLAALVVVAGGVQRLRDVA